MSERPGISLEQWYPLVAPIVGTPATAIVKAAADMAPLLYEGERDAPDISMEFHQLCDGIAKAADLLGGYPVFLRTGLMSGKHQWDRTCHLPSEAAIESHVRAIVEYSELADIFGDRPTDIWVVRELLDTWPAFHAFGGNMPITRERRYFFEDGKVIGHHPYWPDEAFVDERVDRDDWKQRLVGLNYEDPAEVKLLTAQTEMVAAVIPGAWSVDWLWTGTHHPERWYLTDMAWAEQSYVWEAYPTAPHAFIERMRAAEVTPRWPGGGTP